MGDNDKPGIEGAQKAAPKLAARGHQIAVPPEGIKDGNELLAKHGADAVRAMVEAAVPFVADVQSEPQSAATDDLTDAEIARLAALNIVAYDKVRTAVAKRCGIRASTLDTVVVAKRSRDVPSGQGRPLEFPAPEPGPEPVSGAALLDEIEATFSRFIICELAARAALALWSCATWFEPVAQVAPILNITSPELRCGKSVALSIIGRLAKKPLPSASISSAALFRTIEKFAPTLLIDEADAFLGENEELRGLINSGHTRETAFVVRTVGDDHEPKRFSTWGFKAIAGIGKRAATIEDRAITISLKRKLPGEKVERLRHADPVALSAPPPSANDRGDAQDVPPLRPENELAPPPFATGSDGGTNYERSARPQQADNLHMDVSSRL